MPRMLFLATLMVAMLAPFAHPAHAAQTSRAAPSAQITKSNLKLCNRTSYILYAATAAIDNQVAQTQGWTRIVPGDCQSPPKGAGATLVYARSALAHSGPAHAWGGTVALCVRDANFILRQPATAPSCAGGVSFSAPFAPIPSPQTRAQKPQRGNADRTMNFDEQPAYGSLTAAQLAGVKRLLKDNGYAIGAIDGVPDKVTGRAISDFRRKMRFPDTAGNADLFAALETEAIKISAPAGYTVCNDGSEELLVAMGETPAKAPPVSRGWWRIAGGACAHVVTTPLAADAVYLLAQKIAGTTESGTTVVGGNDRFCVVALEFEIQGRGGCAARGLSEAGFARTVTHGRNGYVAHIGAHGLMTALTRHTAISK